ncbi:MAG: DUF454 domain-containing protein [Clostridium sp.]|nr:DUF454 domain-containing protein [Clostridium sp.]
MKCTIKKVICLTLALLFLILGVIGVILPILPTTPFLLAASFFLARGSEQFNKWFLSTKLYKKHLESFVKTGSMTFKTKIRILIFSTAMLITAIYLASNMYAGIVIICIMLYKYYYFIFNIKSAGKHEPVPRKLH